MDVGAVDKLSLVADACCEVLDTGADDDSEDDGTAADEGGVLAMPASILLGESLDISSDVDISFFFSISSL